MPPARESASPKPRSGEGGAGLRIVVTDARGRRVSAPGLAAWLRRAAPRSARGSVGVALVSDARVRALNRRYRGKDQATDVLSFPAGQTAFKGDIVIARGVAQRQARAMGHSPAVELRVLALHGLLHLLGYDHEHDDGRMRRLEQRLLRENGVTSGLIERAVVRGSTRSPRAPRRHARPEPVEGRASGR